MGPRTSMKEFSWAVQTGIRRQREEQKMKENNHGQQE